MEKAVRVALVSDLHHCHIDWYGQRAEKRLDGFVERFLRRHREEPVDLVLLLGDYSLDFWAWDVGGSYVHRRESRTQVFFRTVASRLPGPVYAIAGNHEQYSPEDFERFTGHKRQGYARVQGNLFILLDTFAGDLDPEGDSDGTYTGADAGYIRGLMDEYPEDRVFLCAHFFDPARETEDFREIVKDKRVACLFQGHTHLSSVIPLGGEWGNKCICQTGNYSYSSDPRGPEASFWGWREAVISENGMRTEYYTPENRAVLDGKVYVHPEGRQDGLEIAFDA